MTEEKQRTQGARTRVVVDRIEDGGVASITVGEAGDLSIDLPVSMLPPDAGEGSHLLITVTLDEEARREAEARVAALQEKLEKRGGAQGQKNFKL